MKLEELFAIVLEVPQVELTDLSSQASLRSWDSFAHINIISTLEETYGVRFTTDEIRNMKSLGDARRLLGAKGVTV
ncbi:MAG TPA: acyl carrier protein [Blastocatellia bacterium]|nr:acyl carrier protein [Blastocatellia bacterium]